MKTINQLFERIQNYKVYGDSDIQISGIVDDSRKVQKENIFVAIKGLTADGHTHIPEAIRNGAAAIVGEIEPKKEWLESVSYIKVEDSREVLGLLAAAWYVYPSDKLRVIGITGTKGKSTTAYILFHILKNSGKKVGLTSSMSAIIGEKEFDTGFHVTNPEPIQLQSFLSQMVEDGCEYAVLEVTSHGLDQKRVAGIKFDIGILTNITHEHLDYHKTMEAYKEAKSKLFKDVRLAILNKEDNEYEYILNTLSAKTQILSYGKNNDADYQLSNIEINDIMSFSVIENGEKYAINTKFLGEYNALNCLAAITAARDLGVPWDGISDTLSKISIPPGRLEKIETNTDFEIYIDFAHTPDSLEKVLQLLKTKTKGRLISIFGCASERDVLKRPMMGEISTKLADVSIFTAEDPRYEDINKIIDEISQGVKDPDVIEVKQNEDLPKNRNVYLRIPERGEAITYAVKNIAQPGDIIVICGKGHEKSMSYNGVEYPWSDHEAVNMALEGKVLEIKR